MAALSSRLSVTLLLTAIGTTILVPAGLASGSPTSRTMTWLAAGDSYASGAGLPHTTKLCARATGQSKAWATVAATTVTKEGVSVSRPKLVACTGAVSKELFQPTGPTNPAEWTKAMGKFDLVTFSFGGDDVGFPTILESCYQHGSLCNDSTVRARIARFGDTYPTFLQRVAKTVMVSSGNVVVMGYPELLEDPSLWPKTDRDTHQCQGLDVSTSKSIRGWGGDLNATIAKGIASVNALPASPRKNVRFTFINPVSGGGSIGGSTPSLFEPASGTRHELCSQGDEAWLNGASAHLLTRSFHPNETGNIAMGSLTTTTVQGLLAPATPLPTVNDTTQSAQQVESLLKEAGLWSSVSPAAECATVLVSGAQFSEGAAALLIGHSSASGCIKGPFGTFYLIDMRKEISKATQCDCGTQTAFLTQLMAPYMDRQPAVFKLGPSGDLVPAPPATPSSASPAPTTTPQAGTPTLGLDWPNSGGGYGEIKPALVSNGGDPTGVVGTISWTSWGGPQATGMGMSDYVATGQTVAGGTEEQVTIVAFDLGTCGGHPAYQEVEWYFPQDGQTFNTVNALYACMFGYVTPTRTS